MVLNWQAAREDGFLLRPARPGEAVSYYRQNYCPLDREAARTTGSRESFGRREVVGFFRRCCRSESCCLLLMLSPDRQIVGEVAITDIDRRVRSASLRICIFRPELRGRGLGSWAVCAARDLAFSRLELHRLELEVFSFNPAAQRVYEKAGFRREGVLRDSVLDGERYADRILMAILEEEWRGGCNSRK